MSEYVEYPEVVTLDGDATLDDVGGELSGPQAGEGAVADDAALTQEAPEESQETQGQTESQVGGEGDSPQPEVETEVETQEREAQPEVATDARDAGTGVTAEEVAEVVTERLHSGNDELVERVAGATVRLMAQAQQDAAEDVDTLEGQVVQLSPDQWDAVQQTMAWSLALSVMTAALAAGILGAALVRYFVSGWRR